MGIIDFRRRLGFSKRVGAISVKDEFQSNSMDDKLKTDLWNIFQIFFLGEDATWVNYCSFKEFIQAIWINYFNLPLDTLDNSYKNTYNEIRERFFSFKWHEVYDFLEYVSEINSPADTEKFKEVCSKIFEKNLSTFRFIGNKIAPITNKGEVEEVQNALDKSLKEGLKGVNIHLTDALKKLSDRNSPDYRNSIKESISAVESISIIISGKKKGTLSNALKRINKTNKLIHPALEKGFISLYGYTSAEDGIRHGILEEKEISFDDAKYMLISCSSFINYLISKSQKAGIKLTS